MNEEEKNQRTSKYNELEITVTKLYREIALLRCSIAGIEAQIAGVRCEQQVVVS